MKGRHIRTVLLSLVASAGTFGTAWAQAPAGSGSPPAPAHKEASGITSRVVGRTVTVDGVEIFYREAGPKDAPTILLLHGFPSSSSMFRDLMPALADRFHVIAPDYPGFGQSAQPAPDAFAYTFDNLAKVVEKFAQQVGLSRYTLYVQDYGAPIGFRLATAHPERVTGLIIQNGNAYVEGLPDGFWAPLKEFWKNPTPELRTKLEGFLTLPTTKWQYLHGARDPQNISPDAWTLDQATLDRPGNKEVQIALFKDYGTNPALYPKWQEYFRQHQPPTLIVWGKNDQIFPPAGAEPYKRDLKDIDFNLLDTGHFALEEDGELIAGKIRAFMDTRVARRSVVVPAPADGFGRYVFSQQPGFSDEALYHAFKQAVPIKTMVIYCMDPRCVKVPETVAAAMPGEVYPGQILTDASGNKVGGTATILPIVLAGGRAADALRSIAVAQHLFALENIVVVHHTNCGASSYTPKGIVDAFRTKEHKDISTAFNARDLAITDLTTSLREDVKLIREAPATSKSTRITGYVYNIDTEQLTLVSDDPAK